MIDKGLTKDHGERLLRAALTLRETLDDLSKVEERLIGRVLKGRAAYAFDRISGKDIVRLKQTTDQIVRLFNLLTTGRAEPQHSGQGPLARKRGKSPGGRRPGSTKAPLFEDFVFDLWISTAVAGGKLSFEKNTPRGTLVDAIEMLRPYLPEKLVPRVPPGPTLQKIIADAKTALADAERAEKFETGRKTN